MPSFDIVNRINMQEIDNAVNIAKKEVATRYDFRGSNTEITLNKHENKIHVVTADEMKMKAVRDMIVSSFVRRKVDPKCLDYKDIENTSHGMIKRDIVIQEGIDKEIAKKIVKLIKGQKLKVQAAIQDNQVRVTGKKIDNLQEIISMLKEEDFGIPLQFVNMKK